MWCNSKKLFRFVLEGKNLLLAEVVLDTPCFELTAFQVCSLFICRHAICSQKCLVLYFSTHVSRAVSIKLSTVSYGRTDLLPKLVYSH